MGTGRTGFLERCEHPKSVAWKPGIHSFWAPWASCVVDDVRYKHIQYYWYWWYHYRVMYLLFIPRPNMIFMEYGMDYNFLSLDETRMFEHTEECLHLVVSYSGTGVFRFLDAILRVWNKFPHNIGFISYSFVFQRKKESLHDHFRERVQWCIRSCDKT